MTSKKYYIETDGKLYLIKKNKVFHLPEFDDINFKIRPYTETNEIVFAKPLLKYHPVNWLAKEKVFLNKQVDSSIKYAILKSLPRISSKVIIEKDKKVLLVFGNRGFSKGIWNLPGGFINHCESPEEAVVRETFEEINVKIKVEKIVGIYSLVFKNVYHIISIIYTGRILSGRPLPNKSEIEKIKWFSLKYAMKITKNPFVKLGLKDYLKML